jgi:CII-binding regulator of phage lambda lysogenization HflD
LLSTLNWRRDPGYELRMLQFEQRKMQHELRMRQLGSEIEQIEKETEQLRRENAREKALSALIEQHCFPDDSNSTPLPPTEPGSSSS